MKNLWKEIFIFAVFFLATVYVTFPLIFRLNNVTTGFGDELLIAWILNWNIHSFAHNIFQIFNTNSYYPYHNTLAYSDTFFTLSAFLMPFKLFFKEPIAMYNIGFIISITTLGWGVCLLTRHVAHDRLSAVLSGAIVAYSSYTLSKFMHLQLLNICLVPISLIFFLRYIEHKKIRDYQLFLILSLMQLYNSILPAYFIMISVIIIASISLYKKRVVWGDLISGNILISTLVFVLLLLPIAIPYFSVSKEFSYVRDIRDSIQFANRPEYTLYPSNKTKLNSFLHNILYKNDPGPFFYDGYISAVFFVLFLCVIFWRIYIRNKNKHTHYIDMFLAVSCFAFILSLGPAFQWRGHVIKKPFIIPLPYALFYYIVPGFAGMRNSARWEMLYLVMGSSAIGIWMSIVLNGKKWVRYILCAALIVAVLFEVQVPYDYFPIASIKRFPPVYQAINSLPANAVVAELPWYNWDMLPYSHIEQLRLYYSTSHFRPLVNGASGFSPPAWQRDAKYFASHFPDKSSIDFLRKSKIMYLVAHSKEYDMLRNDRYTIGGVQVASGSAMIKKIMDTDQFKLIGTYGPDYLFSLKK